jgi:hypothetical protein
MSFPERVIRQGCASEQMLKALAIGPKVPLLEVSFFDIQSPVFEIVHTAVNGYAVLASHHRAA